MKSDAPYAEIDKAITRWVDQHAISLCREWQGEARFWYLSHGTECFQIAVDHPTGGRVTIHAWSIETDGDAEFQAEWSTNIEDIEDGLANATRQIAQWAERTRLVR